MIWSAASGRSREPVVRICESAGESRAVRLQLLEEIRQVVSFDAYAWLLTDPETSVGSAPLADVPCLPELALLIRLKYLTEVNRWTTLHGAPVALLQEATGGDPSRSLLWRDLLDGYGIGDVASLVFKDRFGCWGFSALGSPAPWPRSGRPKPPTLPASPVQGPWRFAPGRQNPSSPPPPATPRRPCPP